MKNKQLQSLFKQRYSPEYTAFELSMTLYDCIIEPLARSIWSLEAAHTNASDVFVFWLAIASYLKNLFSKPRSETGIPPSLATAVVEIFNKRYESFFGNKEVYFVTFILDPRKLTLFSGRASTDLL